MASSFHRDTGKLTSCSNLASQSRRPYPIRGARSRHETFVVRVIPMCRTSGACGEEAQVRLASQRRNRPLANARSVL
jgi:hypothetical protein